MVVAACYQNPQFADCALTCTNELGCPDGLSCLGGVCRVSGHTGSCPVPDGGGPPGDVDGDGIANGSDNCMNVYNPMQENEDGDQFGDICDPCPIGSGAANNDTDGDHVGDGCDPFNDGTMPDTILVFEPFNGPPADSFGTQYGGTWQYTGGTANVTDAGPTSGILWGVAGKTNIGVYTRVMMTVRHTAPSIAGTVDRGDTSGIGIGCTDTVNNSGGLVFAVTDTSTANPIASAPGNPWNLGSAYDIRQVRTSSGTTQCDREDGQSVGGTNASATGVLAGVVVHQADASFDYVLIVGH